MTETLFRTDFNYFTTHQGPQHLIYKNSNGKKEEAKNNLKIKLTQLPTELIKLRSSLVEINKSSFKLCLS